MRTASRGVVVRSLSAAYVVAGLDGPRAAQQGSNKMKLATLTFSALLLSAGFAFAQETNNDPKYHDIRSAERCAE